MIISLSSAKSLTSVTLRDIMIRAQNAKIIKQFTNIQIHSVQIKVRYS